MESGSICCRLRLLSYIILSKAKNINTIGFSAFLQHNNQRKRLVTAGIIGAAQIFIRAPHDILKSQPMSMSVLFELYPLSRTFLKVGQLISGRLFYTYLLSSDVLFSIIMVFCDGFKFL